jgi:Rad3-related DNA helicase
MPDLMKRLKRALSGGTIEPEHSPHKEPSSPKLPEPPVVSPSAGFTLSEVEGLRTGPAEPPEPPPWLDEEPADLPITEEARIEVPDVASAFVEDGPIAQALGDRYRSRQGQVEMAQLIRQALMEEKAALIEAGTGCGKSFAYLIPLVWSGTRALVTTANKTLQTQLWEKDIPTLQRVSPRPFTAALLKGRPNYVCVLKLKQLGQQPALPGLHDGLSDLMERLQDVPSGDVEELRLFSRLRQAVTAGQHDCLRDRCPLLTRCYYELAKVQAEKADIVVVNHALLAFSLIRPILSPRPVVVVDEAHELERYVVNALRLGLEYTTVPGFINDEVVVRHVDEMLRGRAVQVNHSLFDFLGHKPDGHERRWTVRGELEQGLALTGHINAIRKALLRTYPPVQGADKGNEENARHQTIIEWAEALADEVRALAEEPPPDQVRYCEEQPGKSDLESIVLYREPVKVADFLRETLFEPVKRVICTGATLTVERRFSHFRRQTGAPRDAAIERVVGGPFDYPNQALLYTPNGLVPQYGEGEEEYVLNLGREIWRLIQASRGRAFVLCTSTRRMNELHELISPHLEYSCYCQGSGLSRAELLDLFQNDAGGAVLFATKSFWEGVDIPGPALSLVIIDKLPFAPHRDPVVRHRQQLIRDRGGDPFNEMSLPEAILALKQGVGRLIRTETDRGVMAILDSRINTKRYGQKIVASLPRARRTRRIQDVRRFFAQETAGVIPPNCER